MDGVTIRVPYRNLNEAELELVGLDDDPAGEIHDHGDRGSTTLNLSPSSPDASNGARPQSNRQSSLKTLILSSMVGAGVQFGWALQLSLLTPYIQTLGIGHAFSSFIWLCGPITGFIVQPCVGVWSDRSCSKYGRRRPFIFVGCIMICAAVSLIGFSSDIGYYLGDTKSDCRVYSGSRYRAAAVFIFGFWMLDLANNTVQGPARALLADLSGFSAGASGQWHRWFPFLTTKACCEVCGNLKGAFLVAVAFLLFCTFVTLQFAKEVPLEAKSVQLLADSAPLMKDAKQHGNVYTNAGLPQLRKNREPETNTVAAQLLADSAPLLKNAEQHGNGYTNAALLELRKDQDPETNTVAGRANCNGSVEFDSNTNKDQIEAFNNGPTAVLVNILTSLRHLPHGMHSVLLVMALTWLSWFPFFLFDTDWMGREVYHGDPKGSAERKGAYQNGVREGALGLLLNSVVLGASSFLIEPMCRRLGARLVWGLSNFIVFICMAAIAIISFWSDDGIRQVIGGNRSVRVAALVIFSLLGFPLSVTYSVPFSVTAELTSGTGGGQGLATGVLNLAIVLPQMIVSLGAGPWDALFGGGNIPAFVLASLFALLATIAAVSKIPTLSGSLRPAGFHGFG